MSSSSRFSVPYLGMKDGFHAYHFDIGDDFFELFENSPVKSGSFTVKVEIDKRADLSDLDLYVSGRIASTCDRCLADIQLPVSGRYHFLIKVSSKDNVDDDEVIYLKQDASHLKLDQLFYECICLSLPMSHVYKCDDDHPRPCNDTVLKKLASKDENETTSTDENDIWSGLKGLLKDEDK